MRRHVVLLAVVPALLAALAACGTSNPVAVTGRSSDARGGSGDGGQDGGGSDGGGQDGGGQDGGQDDGGGTPGGDAFGWQVCGDSLECGRLEVPLDYANPDRGTMSLAVVRHLAQKPDERIGSLLVNPGGPGFGGSFLAEQAEFIYGEDLLDRFDIVAWDPRGTGNSSPAVDCVDELDPYFAFDPSPDAEAERTAIIEAAQAFADACEERSGAILPFISTESSARDMDSIRAALGEETISYFGFSYGSELGATWVTLFPETVRAAVLDGASDPTASSVEGGLQQAAGFEQSLDRFLERCADDTSCAFHSDGDPGGALDELLASLDEQPLDVEPDRTPVNQGVAEIAIAQAMYTDFLWDSLAEALAAARDGDGSGLLSLYDDYYQRGPDGTYTNDLEAFQAISCLDDPGVTSVDEVEALRDDFLDVAPRLGASFASSGYACAVWPVRGSGSVTVTGAGAGPILVVGTTGDAATPLDSTRAMADALEEGVLLVVDADQHTGYGVNQCAFETVDNYLVGLVVPAEGTTC
jgi:pimeloyl-ACP methyl ester carboxylesterase